MNDHQITDLGNRCNLCSKVSVSSNSTTLIQNYYGLVWKRLERLHRVRSTAQLVMAGGVLVSYGSSFVSEGLP